MKKYVVWFIIIILFFIGGCMTAAQKNNIMQSWVGSHYSEVIASWGPPTQILDNTDGGKIISWQRTATLMMPGTGTTSYSPLTGTAYTTYQPGGTLTTRHSKTFWADPNGIIYDWAWRDE